MKRFPQKRVAITGAASGLGLSLARVFAGHGWKVALADVQDDAGEAAAQELARQTDAFYRHVDVRKTEDIRQWHRDITSRWGGLDILINNAGVATHGAIDLAPEEDWEWVIDINLMGVVRGCKIFVPTFKAQGYGHIINVASMAGLLHSPEMGSYNATKAGVVAVSETLLGELAPYNTGVSVVCPGFFKTNLAKTARSPDEGVQELIEKLFATSRLSADDIAEKVYRGAESRDFYILPHRFYHALWLLKRYVPPAYLAQMKVLGKKVAARRNRLARREAGA
ncbi:SDR family oxidoreductase [Hahella sp. SMD15-11]|uniref:SDR family oxidoreductase n=1 Tax=Thermohahella caldifontis TaxID=3142973 RepID=A0AB39UU21_9GAMM